MPRLLRLATWAALLSSTTTAFAGPPKWLKKNTQPTTRNASDTDAYDGAAHGVVLRRGAFTSAECDAIVAAMRALPQERDVRVGESVSRVNYWDRAPSGDAAYGWVLDRVAEHVAAADGAGWGFAAPADGAALAARLDFVLLHEFAGGDFFDWHVDTKPADGTGRTVNVNVMLSDAADYEGGALHVGRAAVPVRRGDLYWYPAAFPHKVADVAGGLRHTLVLAVQAPDEAARDATEYWAAAEANHARLAGGDDVPPKLHQIRSEFFGAAGREAEADAAMGDAYAATDEFAQYAEHFEAQGRQLATDGHLDQALAAFALAMRVDPANAAAAHNHAALEEALRQVEGGDL